jgi:archaemetzincin
MRQPAIEIVPVGKVSPHLLQPLPQVLAERFPGREVRIAPQGLEHPGYAFSPRRKQYQANLILEQLARFDPQAERVLGIADLDLFVPGLNFIFGQAQVGGPAAIIALARLHQEFWGRPANPQLVQERILKEAVHELGHTYGLEHCRIPTCVMHFSNTLEETDRKSDQFCSGHQTQLNQTLEDDEAKKR